MTSSFGMPKRFSELTARQIGLLQLILFAVLLYLASFGGILLGMIPPALIIGGKGVGNLFTRYP